MEEWRELIFLRDSIEIGALDEIIAAMTEAHFAAAEACLVEMADAWAEHDYRRYRRVQRQLHATILGAPGYTMLKETAMQLNDRLDRYGRLLVTRDQARWGDDLEMNRRRVELIRQGDAKTYARMIKGRHASGTRIIARLTGQTDDNGEAVPARSKGRSSGG
jgi:DNA-binding GntR family transcriptional regulator